MVGLQDYRQLQGPFDVIVEAIGGDVLDHALKTIAPGGVIIPFGNVSGKPSSLNAFAFVGHEGARIQSFLSYAAGPESAIDQDLTLLADLVNRGELHPRIAKVFSWQEAADALKAVEKGDMGGKIILKVHEEAA